MIEEKVNELGWSLHKDSDNEFDISRYSPAGQDFHINITANSAKEFLENLTSYCEDFDTSTETYLWLDSDGHGKKGAPYDMKDVYEDMEWCITEADNLLVKLNDMFFLEETANIYREAILAEEIVFEEKYECEVGRTVTLYFIAPTKILKGKYPEAESAEISVEYPMGTDDVEAANVTFSPTKDGLDYEWHEVELPSEIIQKLMDMAKRQGV